MTPASSLSPQLSPEKEVILHLKPKFSNFARMSFNGRNLSKCRQTIPCYEIVQFSHMGFFFSGVQQTTAKQKMMLRIFELHFLIFPDGSNDFFVRRWQMLDAQNIQNGASTILSFFLFLAKSHASANLILLRHIFQSLRNTCQYKKMRLLLSRFLLFMTK